ncbi:phage integrase family protein [Candidatus Methylocalor cossyra]
MPLNPRETALVRGWIEGLPYPVLAKTYLDRDDALAARAEVRALLARLVRKARQLGQGALAELFAAPPEGDRAAWRVKAHRALDRLAAAPEPVPGPADPVALWFEPRLAEALAAAGLPRLADLQAARVAGGARWWRPYPGIGPAAAQAVEACLAALPAGLPAPRPTHPARPPSRPSMPAVRRWTAATALTGSAGAAAGSRPTPTARPSRRGWPSTPTGPAPAASTGGKWNGSGRFASRSGARPCPTPTPRMPPPTWRSWPVLTRTGWARRGRCAAARPGGRCAGPCPPPAGAWRGRCSPPSARGWCNRAIGRPIPSTPCPSLGRCRSGPGGSCPDRRSCTCSATLTAAPGPLPPRPRPAASGAWPSC